LDQSRNGGVRKRGNFSLVLFTKSGLCTIPSSKDSFELIQGGWQMELEMSPGKFIQTAFEVSQTLGSCHAGLLILDQMDEGEIIRHDLLAELLFTVEIARRRFV
jgi:hypothetical protein